MTSEAVSGRRGAARHAVADDLEEWVVGERSEQGSDNRPLIDRLLADSGDRVDDRDADLGWPLPERAPGRSWDELARRSTFADPWDGAESGESSRSLFDSDFGRSESGDRPEVGLFDKPEPSARGDEPGPAGGELGAFETAADADDRFEDQPQDGGASRRPNFTFRRRTDGPLEDQRGDDALFGPVPAGNEFFGDEGPESGSAGVEDRADEEPAEGPRAGALDRDTERAGEPGAAEPRGERVLPGSDVEPQQGSSSGGADEAVGGVRSRIEDLFDDLRGRDPGPDGFAADSAHEPFAAPFDRDFQNDPLGASFPGDPRFDRHSSYGPESADGAAGDPAEADRGHASPPPADQRVRDLPATPRPVPRPAPEYETDEFVARRQAAEQAAAEAEAAAAAAAERASAAIAVAARAADEAEAAAEAAARAAEQAQAAAEAEQRALAAREDQAGPVPAGPVHAGPGRAVGAVVDPAAAEATRAHSPVVRRDVARDDPEPPTEAVPLPTGAGPGAGPGAHRLPPRGAGHAAPPRVAGPGWSPPHDSATIGMPIAGRGGHRRAERPGRLDADATEVMTGLGSLRGREIARPPEPAPVERTGLTPAVTAPPPERDQPVESDRDREASSTRHRAVDDAPLTRRILERLTTRPVLLAVLVAAVLAIAAVVAAVISSQPEPAAAAAVESPAPAAAPLAPAEGEEQVAAVDPDGENATAFLAALRESDIPTSRSGRAETEAAAAICEQLDRGASEAQVVRTLPAVLPDLTRSQSADVVTLARRHYCAA